jgi:hypothetical protein
MRSDSYTPMSVDENVPALIESCVCAMGLGMAPSKLRLKCDEDVDGVAPDRCHESVVLPPKSSDVCP